MTYKDKDEFVQDYGFSPSECTDKEERAEARLTYSIYKGDRYGDII